MQLDLAILRFVNLPWACPFLDNSARLLSELIPVLPVLAAAIWLLLTKGPRGRWLFWGLALLFFFTDWFTTQVLRDLIPRARPYQVLEGIRYWAGGGWHVSAEPLSAAISLSFPSAHAANSFGPALYFMRINRKVGWSLVGMALLVGLARVYMGLHYPSDVVAGFLWGGLCGWGIARLMTWAWERIEPLGRPWLFTSGIRYGIAIFLSFWAIGLFAYVPEIQDAIWQFSMAADGLLRGEWLLLPGNGLANLCTPSIIAVLFWVPWLPSWLAPSIWSLLSATMAVAVIFLVARLCGLNPLNKAFWWGFPMAAVLAAAYLYQGVAAFAPPLAALVGYWLLKRGDTTASAISWSFAVALDPTLLTLAAVLILQRRFWESLLMVCLAAVWFLLPDLLLPSNLGGSRTLDFLSKNLLHLEQFNSFVSNHWLGQPLWFAGGDDRLSRLFADWPLARAFVYDTVRVVFSLLGLLLAIRVRSLPTKVAAAFCVASLWSLVPGQAGLLLVLPCFLIGEAAFRQPSWIGCGSTRARQLWLLLVCLGFAVTTHLLLRPFASQDVAALVPPGLLPGGFLVALVLCKVWDGGLADWRFMAEGAFPRRPRVVFLTISVVIFAGLCLAWSWRVQSLDAGSREFVERAPLVAAAIIDQAQASQNFLPSEAPIPRIGGLRTDDSPCANPRVGGVDYRPWEKSWNIVYQLGGHESGRPWACLQYVGDNGRPYLDQRVWDAKWRRSHGYGRPLPRSLNRIWCVDLTGLRLPEPAVDAGSRELDGRPCRVRYRDGVHLGQVMGGKCAVGWGGKVIETSHFEIVELDPNAVWVPGSKEPPPLKTPWAGVTPDGGIQAPCRVRINDRLLLGKQVRGKCLVAWRGREASFTEFDVPLGREP